MAVHQLLLRGIFVGLVAGLLAFGFAKVFGEPAVDRAIAFESAQAKAHGEPEEPELVSREIQASVGLLTAVTVYGAALGGLFSLVFAIGYGRASHLPPKAFAAVLALLCFIAAFAVPYLKYPANPPAVGAPVTIGLRTAVHFSMIALSVIAMLAASSLKRLLEPRIGGWNAMLVGVGVFLVLVGAAMLLLPMIDEVPADFPATTLWRFRIASFGVQAVLWMTIGLLFGAWVERRDTGLPLPRRP